jgi:prolyl 4-hydroxylase
MNSNSLMGVYPIFFCFKHDFCKKACNKCPFSPAQMKKRKTMEKTEEYTDLLEEIALYGTPQRVDGVTKDDTFLIIKQTLVYMKNFIHAENPTHSISKTSIDACTNNHDLCSYWALSGECEENPSYMVTKCAPSCQSCHKIDFNVRCPPRPDDAKPGLTPGDLNLVFENIVKVAPGNATEEGRKAAGEGLVQDDGTPYYTVNIHSLPQSKAAQPNSEGLVAVDKERDLSEDPWVLTFDNFLTDEECDHLIQLGYKFGYKRSRDVGKETVDGSFDNKESTSRTSENAWCSDKEGCRSDPIVQRILDRLKTATGIPTENYEDLQLLKYEPGQFYRVHHDYIPHHKDRHAGPRILTFFLYLSDVEEGGGTGFKDLDITVTPKKGRALLWPSVLNNDPMEKDGRMRHEALIVGEGTKFAANAWIHMYEFVEAHKNGCA